MHIQTKSFYPNNNICEPSQGKPELKMPLFKIEFKVDLAHNILTKYDKDGETHYSLKLITNPEKTRVTDNSIVALGGNPRKTSKFTDEEKNQRAKDLIRQRLNRSNKNKIKYIYNNKKIT